VNEYEGMRRVVYGDGATFVPVCERCNAFVMPDATIKVEMSGLVSGPNATCSRCGRTRMLFEGFV